MKYELFGLAAIAAVLFSMSSVNAHVGDHSTELRIWQDADGLFEFEADFALWQDDRVLFCRPDGGLFWMPEERLSSADREWVSGRMQEVTAHDIKAPVQVPVYTFVLPSRSRSEIPIAFAFLAGLAAVSVFGRFACRQTSRRSIASVAMMLVLGSFTMVSSGNEFKAVPPIQKHFEAFKDKLEFRSDDDYFYVGGNGFPDHPMMVGIRNWQQQVPLPQPYTGKNAWRIPLNPKVADKPISAKNALFSGAIAVAVNGVPIFNALNNRGEDAYLIGELDEHGGHCGKGDDYHYHAAPAHLEKIVGKGNPIAYALDGFAIYSYTDASGKEPKDLDEYNGRMEKEGYRYYSTRKYPYINGGLRGEVTIRNDRVEPQPRDTPIRPSGRPLRGAKITDFVREEDKKTYTVKYELQGKTHSVRYTMNREGNYTFVFTDGDGKSTTETYTRREPKEGKERKEGKDQKKDGKEKKDRDAPPKSEDPTPTVTQSTNTAKKADPASKFVLTSPAFENGGKFPVEYTGDGEGVSPPLAWSGAPDRTKFYAVQLWHKPNPNGTEVKSYWVIYNIPATITKLEKNSKGVGKAGYNGKDRTDYDPMKSKGPGTKEYNITIYALSAEPKFGSTRVNRADLLAAIKDITLAESTISYKYDRTGKTDGKDEQPEGKKKKDRPSEPEGKKPETASEGETLPIPRLKGNDR